MPEESSSYLKNLEAALRAAKNGDLRSLVLAFETNQEHAISMKGNFIHLLGLAEDLTDRVREKLRELRSNA